MKYGELSSVLCNDLDGWDWRLKREWIYVCIQLIHLILQQRLTQHCKATVLHKKGRMDGMTAQLEKVRVGTYILPLKRQNPLEEGLATNSSILAWRIP